MALINIKELYLPNASFWDQELVNTSHLFKVHILYHQGGTPVETGKVIVNFFTFQLYFHESRKINEWFYDVKGSYVALEDSTIIIKYAVK